MIKMTNFSWLLVFISALFHSSPSLQSDALELRMRRDFGYAGGGAIQGTFTLRVTGPQDLNRVTFLIDGETMLEDVEAPFELRFSTGSYSLGAHVLSAVGQTAAGREVRSNEIHVEFVSASEGFQAGMRILGPMLAIIAAVTALTLAASFAGAGKLRALAPGTPRQYGPAGGAICPRCSRAFPRHFFSPNMLVGKLERCPFCGKWSIVAGQSMAALRKAEQAELEDAEQTNALLQSEDDKLHKELDDSRYLDG